MFLIKLRDKFDRSKSVLKEKLKTKFVIIIISILIFFFFVSSYAEEIKTYLDGFVLAYGLIAVFTISFFSDIALQPIGPDVPILTAILLGLNPIPVFFTATIASGLATMLSYYIGFKYGANGFLRFYGREKYNRLIKAYNQYHFIVPIAAFTPVPFVPICWISGIMKMQKIKFLLYSVGSRGVRLALVTVFAVGIR